MEKRQNWIATLRGIAALLVFLSHLSVPTNAVRTTALQFMLGRCGVVIFFLIMGYLAFDAREKRNGKQYLFNRFMRIYPIFWILVTLYFVLMHICHTDYTVGIRSWLLNLTLFNEFLMVDCIIGASWMLPMQIVFFVALAILNVQTFKKAIRIRFLNINACTLFVSLLMILACITGYARYATGLPFPTAFFLLLALGVLGMSIRINGGGFRLQILLFEIGLMISTYLSYSEKAVQYLLAYNVGIIMFAVFEKKCGLRIRAFENLGKIGFAFFLGAKIPMIVMNRLIPFSYSLPLLVCGFALEFVLGVAFAALVTRRIEEPVLAWAKKKEKCLA